MHNYDELRRDHYRYISQTIDSPITIFDFWHLTDGFVALSIILVFGLIFYQWVPMILLLLVSLIFLPMIRSKYPKGIFFHWPYKNLGITLPGLINPKGKRKFSD